MTRKVSMPDTSLEANKAAVVEMRAEHYQRIVKALEVLKTANYEKIAEQAGFNDRNQVSRRMKEMEGLGMVYKPGLKSSTSSGRNAYNYCLTNEKKLSVSEQVDALIHNATKPDYIQGSLL